MFPRTFTTGSAPILISCAPGLVPFLVDECRALGYEPSAQIHTAVTIEGCLADAMRLNLRLFTAYHVHYRLAEFSAQTPDDLYKNVLDMPWETLIAPDEYLSVTSVVKTHSITDSRFANVRVKDGIVDRLQKRKGARCNSGSECTGVVVHLYWKADHCQLYLDTSGIPLDKRSYRVKSGPAPMQETLAAALLRASGYTSEVPFVNPMCGTGTLAIEAALLACKRPPGLVKRDYAFRHLLVFDRDLFEHELTGLKAAQLVKSPKPIIATDVDAVAIASTKANAAAAGVERSMEFAVCDFVKTRIPPAPGIVMLNPEYGLRMGDASALKQTYRDIGGFFKHNCAGYRGFLFTGSKELPLHVGLKAESKKNFLNGEIECRLYEYELYAGRRE